MAVFEDDDPWAIKKKELGIMNLVGLSVKVEGSNNDGNKDVGDKTNEAVAKNTPTMAKRPTAHKIMLLSKTIEADLRP